jgi:hypothetical protein
MPHLLRCLAVWTAATVAATAAVTWLAPVVAGPASGFDGQLVRGCAAAAAGATAWLWLGAGITIATSLRGRAAAVPPAVLPTPLRRLVLGACGVVLAGGLGIGAAQAAQDGPHQDRLGGPAAVAGLPVPDRTATAAPAPAPDVVTVEPGDSLWSIAAEHLGPHPTDAEVDAAWRDLYARNRTVVGPDPDLIRPAQRLRAPIPAPVSEVQP